MMIHPSLIEKVSLDAREFNDGVAADIKRSFAYVGPVTVVSHEVAVDEPVCNEMRLIVRMSKPFWRDADANGAGAELWESVRAWLEGKAYKVGSTITNFNETRSEAGGQTVRYDRLVLDMKPYELGIALDGSERLPDLGGLVGRFRALLGSGTIPDDALGVEMPAHESLAAQRADADEAAARAAESGGEPGEERGSQGAVGTEGTGASAPEGTAACGEVSGPDAEGACETGDAASATQVAAAVPAGLAHASDGLVVLDYALWDMHFADGAMRTLDSVAGTWR